MPVDSMSFFDRERDRDLLVRKLYSYLDLAWQKKKNKNRESADLVLWLHVMVDCRRNLGTNTCLSSRRSSGLLLRLPAVLPSSLASMHMQPANHV